ncbi:MULTISPECIES: hypothetical protein [Bacteroidota]|uniref:hypothetical protein n=1 Tax=Bacteroidota TaxID=976 RepID=UPI0028967E2F|nr:MULTISPECIES: hypothetical protein [Bacteroidota]
MKLNIKTVTDFGTHASERVWLEVLEDCNLKNYMLTDTTYKEDNSISNKVRHVHWFEPKNVRGGDEIVFYTRRGNESSESINNGRNTRYFLFWGLDSYVWNNSGDAAILFEINNWKTTKVFAK